MDLISESSLAEWTCLPFLREQYLALIYDDYLDVIRVQVGLVQHVQACAWSASGPLCPSPQPSLLVTCPPTESVLFLLFFSFSHTIFHTSDRTFYFLLPKFI